MYGISEDEYLLLTHYEFYLLGEAYLLKNATDNTIMTRLYNLMAAGGAWGVKNHKYQTPRELLGTKGNEIIELNEDKIDMFKMKIFNLEKEVKANDK